MDFSAYVEPRWTEQDHWIDGFLNTEDWILKAICASTDPEAFFPEKGGSTRQAKYICSRCPVREECLDYALRHNIRYGIWGGLAERQRRPLEKERKVMTAEPEPYADYLLELIELLDQTEGHDDPLVRACRKMVVQSAVALKQAAEQWEAKTEETFTLSEVQQHRMDAAELALSTVTDDNDMAEPDDPDYSIEQAYSKILDDPEEEPLVEDDAAWEGEARVAIAEEKPKRKSPTPSLAQQLMEKHGITLSDVRTWAQANGYKVGDRGMIRIGIVQDYIEAMP